MDFIKRLEKLIGLMEKGKIDILLITKPENVYYLTRLFSSSIALVISKQGESYLLTDSRYYSKAKNLETGFQVIKVKNDLDDEINSILKKMKIRTIAAEEEHLTVNKWNQIEKSCELVKSNNLVEKLREIKDSDEIESIRKANKILKSSFSEIVDYIKPGVKELELASKLDEIIMKNKAHGIAFPTIVATGKNSAVPHHETSTDEIREGDFVLIDAGAIYNHYNSDKSRTFIAGNADEKQIEMIKLINNAQKKAIEYISPGKEAHEIDGIARKVISDGGRIKYFSHGLGHGLGLEIHEEPYIKRANTKVIKEGMVFTIEPGIYLEEIGGVRTEDNVYVTSSGAEILE